MSARSLRPMRIVVAVLCMSLATTLMGASTANLIAPPTLVVFPFRYAEGLDPRYGSDYVTKVSGAITALGGVKVIQGDAGTAQADYLHAAKTAGGDYYLTGYVAPPFNGAMAVIEQIVSARSGTIVWANTAHITGDAAILEQGPVVHDALLQYATRGYYAIINATPKPLVAPPTAAPKKNGIVGTGGGGPGGRATPPPQPLSLPNEAYGFSSRPTAPPKIYASATHPSRFVVLTIAGKTVPPVIRDYAVSSLMTALSRHGQTVAQGDPASSEHPIIRGPQICSATGAGYLVFGSVATKSSDATDGNVMWTDASLNVAVYDCGAQKFEQAGKPMTGGSFSWKTAVDRASNTAVTDYLLRVATVARS